MYDINNMWCETQELNENENAVRRLRIKMRDVELLILDDVIILSSCSCSYVFSDCQIGWPEVKDRTHT